MYKHIPGLLLAVLAITLPSVALASGSASIAGLTPGDTVGVGTAVSFSVITSGFTNPSFKVTDSIGGGVTSVYINSFGEFSWTPNNSNLGAHTITVEVSDSLGDDASVSQTITVVAPGISIGSLTPGATVRYGNPVDFTLTSTGLLNPQYTVTDSYPYSSVNSGLTNSAGNFHWTPLYQDIGVHTLTATARDYQGHLSTATQQITVTGPITVDTGPVTPSTIHPGDAVSFSATTTGFTSPQFTVVDAFTSSLGTSTLAIDGNGIVTWVPNLNDIGSHLITVSVGDSSGNTGSVQKTITVMYGQSATAVPVVNATASTAATANASAYIFKTLLKVGSSGNDVTALQQLLSNLGFLTVTPTGYFGALTKAALQKYQTAHGIDSVGYAGPLTRQSLSSGK